MASRRLRLRRADACAVCGAELPAGSEATWSPSARTVTCLGCTEQATAPTAKREMLDAGQAAASAAREHRRRKQAREQRIRRAHPWLGGLILATRAAPQSETAFQQGARGEQAVAESLLSRTSDSPTIILHDRHMPGGRGNIDHVAIAPTGVFVIDTKSHHGKVSVSRPLLGAPQLLIAGRDRTSLVDGLDRQISVVRGALAAVGHPEIPTHGVFCFTNADLPLLRTPSIRGHLLLYRKSLAKRLTADGPLDSTAIETLARSLAAALPPA